MNDNKLHEGYERLDARLTGLMARATGITALRISLGLVFVWFGFLKFFPGLSPAADLAGVYHRRTEFWADSACYGSPDPRGLGIADRDGTVDGARDAPDAGAIVAANARHGDAAFFSPWRRG